MPTVQWKCAIVESAMQAGKSLPKPCERVCLSCEIWFTNPEHKRGQTLDERLADNARHDVREHPITPWDEPPRTTDEIRYLT